ncbi:MAG: PAS domain-containing protein [Gemmatimonadota bacterium]|nr:PAS domain-containing protein [Gemmatimonadota bacterium]
MAVRFASDDPGALETVLSILPQLILIVDEELTLRYMNRPQGGYRPDQVVGMSIFEVVDPEYRDEVRSLLEGVFASGEPAVYEVAALNAQGERQWHEGVMLHLPGEDMEPTVVISTTNVTERRQLQEEAATLRSLIPLCSWCKRVRTDSGYWATVESYLERAGKSRVTHSLCTTCEATMLDAASGDR